MLSAQEDVLTAAIAIRSHEALKITEYYSHGFSSTTTSMTNTPPTMARRPAAATRPTAAPRSRQSIGSPTSPPPAEAWPPLPPEAHRTPLRPPQVKPSQTMSSSLRYSVDVSFASTSTIPPTSTKSTFHSDPPR